MIMDELVKLLSASAFVKKHAPQITNAIDGPILDIAGGSGRNAFYLAMYGAEVICIDRNREKFDLLRQHISSKTDLIKKVSYYHLDLINSPWIFKKETAEAIICVHYQITNQFLRYCSSLKSGGWLLIETVGGQGDNYLELPQLGLLNELFNNDFEMKMYQERAVGPRDENRVAVKLLAQKK